MFILSKVLVFLIQPINWIFFLLILAIWTKRKKLKKRAFKGAILLFILFTNPLILQLGIAIWEVPPIEKSDIPKEVSCGIVLGGYYKQAAKAPQDRFQLNEGPNRLINALELLEEEKVDWLLLSGGNGSIVEKGIPESLLVDSLLDNWCWPDSLTITETKSRNTYENIIYSKEILNERQVNTPVLLITSAFHMRRSLAICKKQGLEAISYSTDPMRENLSWAPNKWFLPDAKALHTWNILIKEWVGIVVYKLRGYA